MSDGVDLVAALYFLYFLMKCNESKFVSMHLTKQNTEEGITKPYSGDDWNWLSIPFIFID
jgi:hypothetical protein